MKMAGLSVVGRDHYGVFPLRGKLLNVREASSKQIMDNEEIQNIKKILGLQQNKEYTNVKSLRYGHLMIMADQVGLFTYKEVLSCFFFCFYFNLFAFMEIVMVQIYWWFRITTVPISKGY